MHLHSNEVLVSSILGKFHNVLIRRALTRCIVESKSFHELINSEFVKNLLNVVNNTVGFSP